jgi:thiamine-phosphate pyrophosphorylase
MKDATEELFEETAIEIQRMCKECGATFIIDDNVALANRIGADGVHLGKNDMPIVEARKILGDKAIIGGTINTFDDIAPHLLGAPDYFGCGPFRHTTTKRNLAPILGLDGYRNIISKMHSHNIDIPLIAIGGIRRSDIPQLIDCGVSGIALSSSVLKANCPISEMRELT